MCSREDFELVAIIADVLAPELASVFKPREVASVCVAWEEPVLLPDGSASAPTQFNAHLNQSVDVGNQDYDADQLRAYLVDEFLYLRRRIPPSRGGQQR